MKSNDDRSIESPQQEGIRQRRPAPRGGGGGSLWAGYAMALLLGSRTLISLIRSVGPVGGAAILATLLGGVPLLLGVRTWRERRDDRARAERWAAKRRAKDESSDH